MRKADLLAWHLLTPPGRVFLFLYTDDFWRDFHSYKAKRIVFIREPREEGYGTVAVFEDLYGNLWDLLQPRTQGCSFVSTARLRTASR